MNRQNFGKDSVSNYPMTIDRMAEAQGDWQVPMKILEKLLPTGNCIIAGCESKGAAGWVCMRNEQGQWEVFEVRAGAAGHRTWHWPHRRSFFLGSLWVLCAFFHPLINQQFTRNQHVMRNSLKIKHNQTPSLQ